MYSVSIRACNRYHLFRYIPIYSDIFQLAATLQCACIVVYCRVSYVFTAYINRSVHNR
nr:MAG TPA: hypothetical protein [Caudoviricetes sp.]